ncbi:MAG: polysaccharide biosynthesis protein [Thermomicrobiales bacterium]
METRVRGDAWAAAQTVLIVGVGGGGTMLAHEMTQNRSWGFRPVAFVDDDPRRLGACVHGLPVLGSTADIPAIVDREQIDVVIIAIPSATDVAIARISEIARRSTARILTMPSLGALLRGEANTTTLWNPSVTDVLGRSTISPDVERCRQFIAGRRILITGAAGSIGQELTRQVAQLAPASLIALDVNESGLFDLQQEIAPSMPGLDLQAAVASVTNRQRIDAVLTEGRPEIVFHAAALKHVPLMEAHPEEAVMINAVGTFVLASAAAAAGVARFVLVSTDKAVHPRSVMGATKRVAELAVNAVAATTGMSACSVRFGNVLGSRGSVIPLFQKQIAGGGPVTVTDPLMKRYFMTIPEAAHLIIQAGAFGHRNTIYMLDMGEEVSILDLATRMIRLHGLRVGKDIEIVITGLRPGEKLREELAHPTEVRRHTSHPRIHRLVESGRGSRADAPMIGAVHRLRAVACGGDRTLTRRLLFATIADVDGGVAPADSMSFPVAPPLNGAARTHGLRQSAITLQEVS